MKSEFNYLYVNDLMSYLGDKKLRFKKHVKAVTFVTFL